MNERIRNIQKAVEKAAEYLARHLKFVVVIEMFRGQTMWEGVVEIFALEAHRKAKRAYGWSVGEGADAHYIAVVEIPPVDSPNTAVRASIAAEAKK